MQKIHTIWWFSVVQYIPCRHSLLISVCIYYRSFCPCHKLCYMDPTLWCSTGSQQLERNQVILYLKSKRIFFGPVISESIAFFISVTPSDYPLSLCTKWLTLFVDVHSPRVSAFIVGIARTFLVALTLGSLFTCGRCRVAAPAPVMTLDSKEDIALAFFAAPGKRHKFIDKYRSTESPKKTP